MSEMMVKFAQGATKENLDKLAIDPGAIYIVTDLDEMYYDTQEKRAKLVDSKTLVYDIDNTTVLNTLKPNTLIVKELPVANVSYRGCFALLDNGTDDILYICKKVSGSYKWMKLEGTEYEEGTGNGSEIIPPTGGEDPSETTAVLGVAVLGKMKLGEGGA